MTDRHARAVTAADGRRLLVAEWGDLDGAPVIACHGTPGCRLNRHPDEERIRRAGVHLVTYDRPGYGGSDRRPGRSVVDAVADVESIADALGFDRFAVTGGSGGGPHALACAVHLHGRVTRAAAVVSIAPYDVLGPDQWFDGMDPENVKEFGWALEGEARLAAELERVDTEMRARVAEDPAQVLGDFELSDTDLAVLARPEMAAVIRESTQEQSRNGVWGWVDDDLAFTRPWGFDPADVRVPTAISYGTSDVLVPVSHGEWLARTIPDVVVRVDDAGHQPDPDTFLELLYGWLLEGRRWD